LFCTSTTKAYFKAHREEVKI